MKFPRTIRFDVSDANVFPLAAEPDEWAVTGTFVFADTDPSAFTSKEQLAFRNGWLGTGSFGRATFVQVVEITKDEFEGVIESLGNHLLDHFGAPDRETAFNAARDEAGPRNRKAPPSPSCRRGIWPPTITSSAAPDP